MIKKGDSIAIVSLSSGLLGEDFCKHQLKIGKERLEKLGFNVIFPPNALKGINILSKNPKLRAEDLIFCFKNKEIKGIITAIGGNDTYKLAEYIFENELNQKILIENNKFFMGYSDTTINHLMLYKLGIKSYYGLSFLTDFAELDNEMLPYTLNSFLSILSKKIIEYTPSSIVYDEREKFSKDEIGKSRNSYKEKYGYILINGKSKFEGRLFGGCIESLYKLLTKTDEKIINEKYDLFPSDFKDKIIFLETSEEKIIPEKFKEMLLFLKDKGLFNNISGLIVAKPQNEKYFNEYKEVLIEIFQNTNISVAYNFNFGHSYPKMILKYDALTTVDIENQCLRMENESNK